MRGDRGGAITACDQGRVKSDEMMGGAWGSKDVVPSCTKRSTV